MDSLRFSRRRRSLLIGLGGASAVGLLPIAGPAQQRLPDEAYVAAMRQGGCVVLIRHAITVPGIGDPPGMRLDDCSSQRDLSAEGRAQSRRIGRWFEGHGLAPIKVRSSAWCRCVHTAQEAFGAHNGFQGVSIERWSALNSFFQGQGNRDLQIREAQTVARSLAVRRSVGQFEVWVTHQVVVTALTQQYCAMGEMVIARYAADGKPLTVLASGLIL